MSDHHDLTTIIWLLNARLPMWC